MQVSEPHGALRTSKSRIFNQSPKSLLNLHSFLQLIDYHCYSLPSHFPLGGKAMILRGWGSPNSYDKGELNSVFLVSWRSAHTEMLSTHHTHIMRAPAYTSVSLEPPFQISRATLGRTAIEQQRQDIHRIRFSQLPVLTIFGPDYSLAVLFTVISAEILGSTSQMPLWHPLLHHIFWTTKKFAMCQASTVR